MNIAIKKLKKLFKMESEEASLLLKLLEEHKDEFTTGLCFFIEYSHSKGYINYIERNSLGRWVRKNCPNNKIWVAYWFEPGDLKSRIDYLKTFV